MKWYPDLINVAMKDGLTALHLAAANGCTDIVSVLASHVSKPVCLIIILWIQCTSLCKYEYIIATTLVALLATVVYTCTIYMYDTYREDGLSQVVLRCLSFVLFDYPSTLY